MNKETYRKAIIHFLWYIVGALAASAGVIILKVYTFSQIQTLLLGIGLGIATTIGVIFVENKLAR